MKTLEGTTINLRSTTTFSIVTSLTTMSLTLRTTSKINKVRTLKNRFVCVDSFERKRSACFRTSEQIFEYDKSFCLCKDSSQ